MFTVIIVRNIAKAKANIPQGRYDDVRELPAYNIPTDKLAHVDIFKTHLQSKKANWNFNDQKILLALVRDDIKVTEIKPIQEKGWKQISIEHNRKNIELVILVIYFPNMIFGDSLKQVV